ncbi:hypothetical protein GQR58_029661 [Nymphon striatum]|nr:hypothetical protein GQR58_029661 [Nymphon striatum]
MSGSPSPCGTQQGHWPVRVRVDQTRHEQATDSHDLIGCPIEFVLVTNGADATRGVDVDHSASNDAIGSIARNDVVTYEAQRAHTPCWSITAPSRSSSGHAASLSTVIISGTDSSRSPSPAARLEITPIEA